jgi:nucleoside-diphosphate-sugar epimerase
MVSKELFAERFTGLFISDDDFPKIGKSVIGFAFQSFQRSCTFPNPNGQHKRRPSLMQELVVITGGAGFIGSHLTEGFLKNGYPVRVIDNLSTGKLANLATVKGSTDFRKIDIRDLAALTQALEGASVVLHHAAISSVPRSFQDQATTHDVNATGTQNLLTAATAAGVRRVIYASSSAVYGNDTADLQRESTLPAPLSPYGLSKRLGELHSLKVAQTTAMETIVLRYFNVFGSQIAPVYEPDRAGDIKHSRADINLSEKLLGGYNRAVLRDGLVRTARWFLSASGRTKKCEE